MSDNIPLFKKDSFYKKADRSEFTALGQNFVFYEFSIGFVSHRFFRDQFEVWLSTMGRYLAGLDDTPATKQRLRDLAWHIWFRGRPAHDPSSPLYLTHESPRENPISYCDLLTHDMDPLFERSTFWLAERLRFDRDLGHIWKVLIAPLHIARTRAHLERLIVDDIPSPWRSALISEPNTPVAWGPDLPSRRRTGSSITN